MLTQEQIDKLALYVHRIQSDMQNICNLMNEAEPETHDRINSIIRPLYPFPDDLEMTAIKVRYWNEDIKQKLGLEELYRRDLLG